MWDTPKWKENVNSELYFYFAAAWEIENEIFWLFGKAIKGKIWFIFFWQELFAESDPNSQTALPPPTQKLHLVGE